MFYFFHHQFIFRLKSTSYLIKYVFATHKTLKIFFRIHDLQVSLRYIHPVRTSSTVKTATTALTVIFRKFNSSLGSITTHLKGSYFLQFWHLTSKSILFSKSYILVGILKLAIVKIFCTIWFLYFVKNEFGYSHS